MVAKLAVCSLAEFIFYAYTTRRWLFITKLSYQLVGTKPWLSQTTELMLAFHFFTAAKQHRVPLQGWPWGGLRHLKAGDSSIPTLGSHKDSPPRIRFAYFSGPRGSDWQWMEMWFSDIRTFREAKITKVHYKNPAKDKSQVLVRNTTHYALWEHDNNASQMAWA